MDIIYEKVKQEIMEELSISNDVIEATKNAENLILTNIRQVPMMIDNNLNIKFKSNEIKFEMFEQIFNLNYCGYFCHNYDEINMLVQKGNLTSHIDYDKKTFLIKFAFINGFPEERTFNDSLQHEIEHAYQIFRKGESLLSSQTIRNLYNKAADILRGNIKTNNIFIIKAAQIIYIGMNFEQDAFVNGMYAFLMKSKYTDEMLYRLNQSDAYQYFKTIKLNFQDIDENIDENSEIEIYNIFGIKYKTLRYVFEEAIKRFQNKIGKVYVKAYQDFLKNNPNQKLSESLTFPNIVKNRKYFFNKNSKSFEE